MTVVLLSGDQRLHHLCGQVLEELTSESRHSLVLADPRLPLPSAEFYVWDYAAETEAARAMAGRDPHRHILVIDPRSATVADFSGIKVVLKPVTKPALAAWLSPRPQASPNPAPNGHADLISSLMDANIRFQERELEQRNFLAKVTHDFRAPLTALEGYCGLLLTGALGPLTDSQRQVLERTKGSMKRLERMTSAILELNSHGGTKLHLREGRLEESLEQAVHELSLRIEEKGIQLDADMTDPPEPLWFDPYEIERVFANLLENACHFTEAGGSIEVRGYPYFWQRRTSPAPGARVERRVRRDLSPNAFRVDVSNTGPRIKPERIRRIFDEYASYGDSHTIGHGLGLAICASIVREHRGRIWAENHDCGPTFSFVLPLKRQIRNNLIPANGGEANRRKGLEH